MDTKIDKKEQESYIQSKDEININENEKINNVIINNEISNDLIKNEFTNNSELELTIQKNQKIYNSNMKSIENDINDSNNNNTCQINKDSNNNTDSIENIKKESQNKRINIDKCQICILKGNKEALLSKYKCPGCQIVYCSLECSKKHKEIFKCSGERDPTTFISLGKFNDYTLNSDFRFLEENKNKKQYLQLMKSRKRMREPEDFRIGKKELFFIARAKDRNCFLKILSEGMKRRNENRTQYISGQECFIWHTRFIFEKNLYDLGEEIPKENIILKSLINENSNINDAYRNILQNINPIQRLQLQFYVTYKEENGTNVPIAEEPIFLLRAEGLSRPGRWFIQLDPTVSLRECLERRVIVENPDIHVVLPKHIDQYNLLTASEADTIYHSEIDNLQERKRRKIEHREKVERYDRRTGDGSNLVDWNNVQLNSTIQDQ